MSHASGCRPLALAPVVVGSLAAPVVCVWLGFVIPGCGEFFLFASSSIVARHLCLFTQWIKIVGNVVYCGERERWVACCDDATDMDICGCREKVVGNVGSCVQNHMDVSGDLQDMDLGGDWRNWQMDDLGLEVDDEAVVRVWKERKEVRKEACSDRSSKTVHE